MQAAKGTKGDVPHWTNCKCCEGSGCIYGDAEVAAIWKGHQVASYTRSHKDLVTLPSDQVRSSPIDNGFANSDFAATLEKILGVKIAFMRPPLSSSNDNVLQTLRSTVAKRPNTILTLNHETVETTSTAVLPHAFEVLQGAGYNLVIIAEYLGLPRWNAWCYERSSCLLQVPSCIGKIASRYRISLHIPPQTHLQAKEKIAELPCLYHLSIPLQSFQIVMRLYANR
ncbi:uncharacterized protein EV420DRAFT_1480882 [Desarmillaria tabescens]|uniref:Chitin deacetylase n=1 Tax=Armillaria tabescens TaxID=1929756 RepID=A0AA39N3P0_ARMTA|nr:uncharacterized protein EV420DRAFT_1480882 [Desarmillaria tabescens]KAK0457006.1 hypothetical protein EV420DRAFT_1480882 [Desarmillaria tabescens]